MPIIRRLTALYERRGIEISTGLSPCHFDNLALANFTLFIKDGRSMTNGFGIAMQEIYFLECLFERFRPRRIFAIGNSTGWSSFALSLINPQARVVAIDAGFDRNSLAGIEFTNKVAAEEGFDLRAVQAVSPQDVASVIGEHVAAPVEFAFIDGYHTSEQVVLDFAAIEAHADPGCVYLFHDVHDFALNAGIEEIARRSSFAAHLLLGTPSGMAIVYDPARHPTLAEDLAPFHARPSALAVIEREIFRRHHGRAYKLGRSLSRRLAWLQRRLAGTTRGVPPAL